MSFLVSALQFVHYRKYQHSEKKSQAYLFNVIIKIVSACLACIQCGHGEQQFFKTQVCLRATCVHKQQREHGRGELGAIRFFIPRLEWWNQLSRNSYLSESTFS